MKYKGTHASVRRVKNAIDVLEILSVQVPANVKPLFSLVNRMATKDWRIDLDTRRARSPVLSIAGHPSAFLETHQAAADGRNCQMDCGPGCGGLLLAVPRRCLETVVDRLQGHQSSGTVIGQIVASAKPRIKVEL